MSFAVTTRKVPSLALVPRGHLKHVNRKKKNTTGQSENHVENVASPSRHEDVKSPPQLPRKQSLSDSIQTEQSPQKSPASKHKKLRQVAEEEEKEDFQAELRLGERFLNMMATMARLSTQPLDDGQSSPPTSLPMVTTGRNLIETAASPLKTMAAKSPPKSPKHVVLEVSKRLPQALQGPLTFDICMLLPTPLNDRQSPLKSPIRRKRLRKRIRRRKRRARRTFQASYTSWPAHASVDYIIDHARTDIAGINAARLVKRLGEHKAQAPSLPRVISMPLPALHRKPPSNSVVESTGLDDDVAAVQNAEVYQENDQGSVQDEDFTDGEDYDDEEDGGEDIESSGSSSEGEDDEVQTPQRSDESVTMETPSPLEPGPETIVDQGRKRPLRHQPAWISPELHAWLVESGLFAVKPRHELMP